MQLPGQSPGKPPGNAKVCAKTTVGAATTLQHGRGLVHCYSNIPGEMPRCDVINPQLACARGLQ